jgi:hypothetical protein
MKVGLFVRVIPYIIEHLLNQSSNKHRKYITCIQNYEKIDLLYFFSLTLDTIQKLDCTCPYHLQTSSSSTQQCDPRASVLLPSFFFATCACTETNKQPPPFVRLVRVEEACGRRNFYTVLRIPSF